MNLKEGTRRLALLLGVIGAILGGFASYLELQSVESQRARHNKFEQLANSEVVQQDRKALQVPGFGPPDDSTSTPEPIPGGPVTVQGPDGKTYQFPEGTDKAAAIRYFKSKGIGSDPFAAIAEPSDSDVNKDGIKTIHWSHNYGVESIETEDGQYLFPTPAPSEWTYLLTALFPIAGFFIPWGAVRAIGWVGAGFVQGQG